MVVGRVNRQAVLLIQKLEEVLQSERVGWTQTSICFSNISKTICNSGTIRDNKKALARFAQVFYIESSAWYFHLVLIIRRLYLKLLNFKKELSNYTLHSRGMSFFFFSVIGLDDSESSDGAVILPIFMVKV